MGGGGGTNLFSALSSTLQLPSKSPLHRLWSASSCPSTPCLELCSNSLLFVNNINYWVKNLPTHPPIHQSTHFTLQTFRSLEFPIRHPLGPLHPANLFLLLSAGVWFRQWGTSGLHQAASLLGASPPAGGQPTAAEGHSKKTRAVSFGGQLFVLR